MVTCVSVCSAIVAQVHIFDSFHCCKCYCKITRQGLMCNDNHLRSDSDNLEMFAVH